MKLEDYRLEGTGQLLCSFNSLLQGKNQINYISQFSSAYQHLVPIPGTWEMLSINTYWIDLSHLGGWLGTSYWNGNNLSSLSANCSLSTSLILFHILKLVMMVFSKNLMRNASISLLGKLNLLEYIPIRKKWCIHFYMVNI